MKKIPTFFSKGIPGRDLKEIFELYLKPYIKYFMYAKDQMDIKVLIGDYFHEDTRAFVDLKATSGYEIKGNMVQGNVIIPGHQGDRQVKRGQYVTARLDQSLDYTDVQFDSGDKEQVFRLTDAQMKYILRKTKGEIPSEFRERFSL